MKVNSVSRAKGRSATAATAYRCGIDMVDERTGELHTYTRRKGVEAFEVVGWNGDAVSLANAIEKAERRHDAKVARDVILALPAEATPAERMALAKGWAEWVHARHGTPSVVAVHAPDAKGDQRNWHAHVLLATRSSNGHQLGAKARELDVTTTSGAHIEAWRQEWGRLVGEDMRSYARRGLAVIPEPALPKAEARAAWRAERDRLAQMVAAIEASEIEAYGEQAVEIHAQQAVERAEKIAGLEAQVWQLGRDAKGLELEIQHRSTTVPKAPTPRDPKQDRRAQEAREVAVQALERLRGIEAGESWLRRAARAVGVPLRWRAQEAAEAQLVAAKLAARAALDVAKIDAGKADAVAQVEHQEQLATWKQAGLLLIEKRAGVMVELTERQQELAKLRAEVQELQALAGPPEPAQEPPRAYPSLKGAGTPRRALQAPQEAEDEPPRPSGPRMG